MKSPKPKSRTGGGLSTIQHLPTPGRHVVILLGVFLEEQLWSTLTSSVCQPTCDTSVRGRSDRYVSTSTRETDRCNGTSHLQALQIIPSQAFSRGRRYTSPRIKHAMQPGLGSNKAANSKSAVDPLHPSFSLEGSEGKDKLRFVHFKKVPRRLMTPQSARASARLSHVTTVVYQLDSCTHFCRWVPLDRHRGFVGTKTAHSNPRCFNAMFTSDPQTAHIPTSPLNPSHDH